MGLDQATKAWANAKLKGAPTESYLGDTFRFTWATNEGAFLSLGGSLPPNVRFWLLTVAVGVLLLGLTGVALFGKKDDSLTLVGYGWIVSGGASNWFDRARFDGSVVDFMNMGIGSLRTGIFNVADVAILIGIGLLFIAGRNEEKAKAAAAAAAVAPPPQQP